MLQKEFENLTGLQVTEENFNEINAIYMACTDDIDEEAFCKDYKKHGQSLIIADLTKRIERLVMLRDYYTNEESETIYYLIDLSHVLDEPSIDRRAEKMCSLRKVIERKIDKGYTLDSVQLDYIKDNLR